MFALFMFLWIVFNGRITLEIIIIGAIVSFLLALLTRRMYGEKLRDVMLGKWEVYHYFGYLFRLVGEIALSSWRVIVLVLHPKREVKPQLFYFEPDIEREGIRVLLANAITLTPGTITVGLRGRVLHVHSLDSSFSDGIETGDMVKALERIDHRCTQREGCGK
jgi:multicomponent Na+:H+ antiporter subunit E